MAQSLGRRHLLALAVSLLGGCSAGASVMPPAAAIAPLTPGDRTSADAHRSGIAARAGYAATPHIGPCSVFPANNAWNRDIANAPTDPHSAEYLASMQASSRSLTLDFTGPGGGIPVNVVSMPRAAFVPIAFTMYAPESDPGPYPIPPNVIVEPRADAHLIVVDTATCGLYEMWNAKLASSGWTAANGATFDLTANTQRPDSWTSADAAGLPIFPGLVKYDELASGTMAHALRFTMSATAATHRFPATHHAARNATAWSPPMGLRMRLRAGYDTSALHGQALVMATTLKRYGMILADNGGDFAITGATDTRYDASALDPIRAIPANAFEVVDPG